MEQNSTRLVVGLQCRRCSGTSVIPVDPETGLQGDYIWACPHCFNGEDREYTIESRYNVLGFKITSNGFIRQDHIDDVTHTCGPLTEQQWQDFRAVRCLGKGYEEVAKERGVTRGAVYKNVAAAEEKLIE